MDERQFDHLSRRLAGCRTRRQALKAMAGAVIATVSGAKQAGAQSCTAHYSPCGGDSDCCAGAVCEYGLCMPGCRIDGSFHGAWTSSPENNCGQCLPDISTTGWSPANEGMSCWSGDPNAGATFCRSGACVSNAPQSCPPHTPCHREGQIDRATGMCVNPPAPAGTPCGAGPMCFGGFGTSADACDGSGSCIGGGAQAVNCAPYRCGATACLTSCASDGDCVDGTACCAGTCVSLNSVEHCGTCDRACPTDSGEVCMGEAICTAGDCGFDPLPAGTPCDDTNLCNGREACDGAGACVAGVPVACAACTACDPESGLCVVDPEQDGDSCPGDGNQCFGAFICASGACVGTDPVVCTALDQCHDAGACDSATGACSDPPKANGAPCDDGNACTQTDTCQNGVCTGSSAVVCTAPDACHRAGTCNPGTGTCSPPIPTVDFQTDDSNCGSCGHDCIFELFDSTCIQGTCQCDLSQTHQCPFECKSLCSSRPDFWRSRFQFAYNSGDTCERATSWMGCYGTVETGTECGTVNAGCD